MIGQDDEQRLLKFMKSLYILFVQKQEDLDESFFFVSSADLSETFLLEFIENLAVFKEVHECNQLVDGKLCFFSDSVLINHFKAKSLFHVLFGVVAI